MLACCLFISGCYTAAGAAPTGPATIPSQCPSSGVLQLDARMYSAPNVSLGNCTVIGKAPGAVIHGKIAFDHGLLKGAIHFEGGGAPSSCVSGHVEVNGDDVRFHGCDIGVTWSKDQYNSVIVSGGRAQFEYGKQVCGLTIVAGSVNITNISGCDAEGIISPLKVGPGPVDLNMANVEHYGWVDIDGMKGRLGGTLRTDFWFTIANSVVNFDMFYAHVNSFQEGYFFGLDNVTGTGSLEYQAGSNAGNSAPITNCQFNDMAYTASMVDGQASIVGTTWKSGSFHASVAWDDRDLPFLVESSDLQNVSVSVTMGKDRVLGSPAAKIISSNISGKISLQIPGQNPWLHRPLPPNDFGLTIANSHVAFSPGGSSSVDGPIEISSSTLSFLGSTGALVGKTSLAVNMSTIQVTGPLPDGPSLQISGDIHMSNVRLDVVNCSGPWLSQPFAQSKIVFI